MSDVPFLMLVFQIKASVHEGKNVQSLIFNATFISKLLFFGYSYFYSKLVEKEMHFTSYLQLPDPWTRLYVLPYFHQKVVGPGPNWPIPFCRACTMRQRYKKPKKQPSKDDSDYE